MDQITFLEAEYQAKTRRIRQEIFLERMDKLIPREQLGKKVARYYPKATRDCFATSATRKRTRPSHMRLLAVLLGIIGIVIAATNVWAFFIEWLSLLGILIPPIGAIILMDQFVVRKGSGIDTDWRGSAFLAWGTGSVVAFMVEWYAPQFSTAISAGIVGGIAYFFLSKLLEPRIA